jgi:hypothetical protein
MRRELGLRAPGMEAADVPVLPEPKHLRPCCAFGSQIGVKVANVAVPLYEIPNLLGPDDLGRHEYDGGTPMVGGFDFDSLKTGEKNGLVFTCRAGFVDTAHLRLWADFSLFLTAWVGANLETGGTLHIKEEGGARKIILQPLEPGVLQQYTRRELATPIAQWLAWQLSVWHEIATWYGWSHVGMFPELASAFSPEDFYSNLLGIRLLGALVYERAAISEDSYNDEMTSLMRLTLSLLGAQPAEIGASAARYADGIWWDSKAKLPSKALVTRRYFAVAGNRISPWTITDIDGGAPPEVAEACGNAPRHTLWFEQSFAGISLRDRVSLEIIVSDDLLNAGFALPERGQPVTPDDFPELIERIRLENDQEFGPGSDSPARHPAASRAG